MTSPPTLPHRFRHTAKRFAETPAILAQERTWTYADLDEASDGMAAGLIARGIAPGDRVRQCHGGGRGAGGSLRR